MTGRNQDAGSFDDASMEDMEALLEQEEMEYRSLRRGDVLDGIVMETSREGVLVDIGSKSEGIIPLSEMHSLGADPLSKVKRGDELLVYVLQPESQEGQVLLSIDRARGEQGWRTLQKRFEDGESFEGEVTGFNKGGLLVNVEGVNAFVPLSQVVGVRPDREEGGDGSLAGAVGRKLRLKVIEINRRRNRVILSERAAMQEYRSLQKDRLLAELHEGEIRRGRITSVRPFGVFIDLGGADGLAHLSELTWERGKTPEEVYKVGDEVDAYVMKVDPETKKIALSLRRAQPERWDEIVDNYRIHQIVPARITKLVTFGAFARIDGPVEGLVHVSELSDRRIQTPSEVVRVGDIVPLKIVRIERDKHRIGLSLRQARDDAENQGWQFDNAGGVIGFPDYLQPEVEAKLGAAPAGERREERPEREEGPRAAAPAAERERPAPQEQRERRSRQSADEASRAELAAHAQDREPLVASGFEALRGFRSEADARAEAQAEVEEPEGEIAQPEAGVTEPEVEETEAGATEETVTDEAAASTTEETATAGAEGAFVRAHGGAPVQPGPAARSEGDGGGLAASEMTAAEPETVEAAVTETELGKAETEEAEPEGQEARADVVASGPGPAARSEGDGGGPTVVGAHGGAPVQPGPAAAGGPTVVSGPGPAAAGGPTVSNEVPEGEIAQPEAETAAPEPPPPTEIQTPATAPRGEGRAEQRQ
jgi:small subunit ribosomal protein S1